MTIASEVSKYDVYRNEIVDDIRQTIESLGCQPILFIGSGLSRRYFGAPSWDELLQQLADDCPMIDKGLGFYKQSLGSAPDVGEKFASLYQEWAWSSGKNSFPADLFSAEVPAQSYIKFRIVDLLQSITPKTVEELKSKGYSEEIDSLQAIKPHAIVTSNYDTMLESIFPDLTPVVGQNILTGMPLSIGEIFKIHGSVEEPGSLVFTRADYNNFIAKKKYLSAKLLTFFSEHPLIFIGYSASDPNIQGILSDIDEALPTKGGTIPNIYILQYGPDLNDNSSPARERIISTGEDRSVRVKLIETADYAWVFDAFAANPALNDVNPKVLRALVARSYNLVRRDIPKMAVDANFEMLSGAVESDESFAKLFGLANIPDYSAMSATHPYALTEVGKMLGGNGWHRADKLLKAVRETTGVDIKGFDNRYHIALNINKSTFNKYSPELVKLLEDVQSGKSYSIDP